MGLRMKRIACLTVGIASMAIYSGMVHAQGLANVEHARASHRAGPVNDYEASLIRQWGASTGGYTSSHVSDARQQERNAYYDRRDRRNRR